MKIKIPPKVIKFLKKSQDKIKSNILFFRKDYLSISKKKLIIFSDSIINFVEVQIQKAKEDVFLNQSRFWVKSITITLLGGTAFGIGWLAIAKTEEIIVTTGKLEPAQGVVQIQMPVQGIIKTILVKEGDRVEKGDVIIKLDTKISNAQKDSRAKSLEINQEIVKRLEFLVDEGAVSEIQLLQQKEKVSQLMGQMTESEVILNYQALKAPVSGIIFDLQAKNPGFVGQSTQPILKIVPYDNLLAKVEIDSSKIGFVSVDKKADISIDSFPASDFGVISGQVISISSDALAPEASTGKGYRFPAKIKLNSQHLTLRNGNKLSLQPGMSLTANIKLRKVTYLQLLLGTFQQKADSLKEL